MKQALTLILLVLFITTACKKDDVAPIDQLPAATREGKNTFGCLINGKAFTPKGSMFSGAITECYYQEVDGAFYFHVSGSDKSQSDKRFNINLNTNGLRIEQGAIIPLKEGTPGEASGAYLTSIVNVSSDDYRTNTQTNGELTITRFDLEKNIVAGTFWFDGVNKKGEKVEIREGRFDMQFTR